MDCPITTTIVRIHGGKWSATTQTPIGPVTAVGDSIEDAKAALDQMLVTIRAAEIKRRHASPPTTRT